MKKMTTAIVAGLATLAFLLALLQPLAQKKQKLSLLRKYLLPAPIS